MCYTWMCTHFVLSSPPSHPLIPPFHFLPSSSFIFHASSKLSVYIKHFVFSSLDFVQTFDNQIPHPSHLHPPITCCTLSPLSRPSSSFLIPTAISLEKGLTQNFASPGFTDLLSDSPGDSSTLCLFLVEFILILHDICGKFAYEVNAFANWNY